MSQHIPSLDGIRGIAVLLVFVAHAGLQDIVPGGLGVTIFFFLSGYLITSLLCGEHAKTGHISLKNFYLRRFFRIIPPMYLTLMLSLFVAWETRQHVSLTAFLFQLAQLTNYYELFGSGNLSPFTGPLWSLAVEEHFYLLFPIALVAMLRHWNRSRIALILASVCLVELLWRTVLVTQFHTSTDYTYMATDTRMDSILFGCILALWKNPRQDTSFSPAVSIAALIVGSGLLLSSLVVRNPVFRETLRYTLQGVALLPIFYCAVRFSHWHIFNWLESNVMRTLGLISYVFYLSHWGIIQLLHQVVPNRIVGGIVAFAATLAFSGLVYVLLEKRMGKIRQKLHAATT